MGVPRQPFVDLHKDKVNEIKRHLMDYVKGLRHLSTASSNNTEARPTEEPSVEQEVQITKDGYPLLQNTINLKSLSKSHLTNILRMYMAAHYRKIHYWLFVVNRNLK